MPNPNGRLQGRGMVVYTDFTTARYPDSWNNPDVSGGDTDMEFSFPDIEGIGEVKMIPALPATLPCTPLPYSPAAATTYCYQSMTCVNSTATSEPT